MKNFYMGALGVFLVVAGPMGATAMPAAAASPLADHSQGSAMAAVHNKAVCGAPGKNDARCHAHVVVGPDGNPKTNAKLPSGYGPVQFHAAYNLPTTAAFSGAGAGVPPTIAIVDAYNDPNIESDLATYSSAYHLPSCTTANGCFKKVNQSGISSPLPQTNASWDLEIALDVEMAHAICQNCKILLVEANSASFSNLLTAIDTAAASGATAVSGSWGAGEFPSEIGFDSHFTVPGVAFTFSSGDSGYGVEYPAASPYVTAVGGTTLRLNANGGYGSEAAWSGSGSGCSSYEARQSWMANPVGADCAKRTVADVSADADPATGAAVYDSVRYYGQSGWFQVGGTSLASPLIAATYALQGVPAGTAAANQLPYSAAAVSTSTLHDIVSGSNGSCGGSYLCTALADYDGPTGLGTPNGAGAF